MKPETTAKRPVRVKSLIEDHDLRSSEHDAILLWLHRDIRIMLGDNERWGWDPKALKKAKENAAGELAKGSKTLRSALHSSDRRKSKTGARALSHSEKETARRRYQQRKDDLRVFREREFDEHVRHTYITDEETAATAQALLQCLESLNPHMLPDPEYPGAIFKEITLQHPVYQETDRPSAGNPKIITFIDLRAVYHRPVLELILRDTTVQDFQTNDEKNTRELRQGPSAYWRLSYTNVLIRNYDVRSAVPSVGTLLREIRYVRDYIPEHEHYIVVSQQKEIEALLESQNIGFFEYRPHTRGGLEDNYRYLSPLRPAPEGTAYQPRILDGTLTTGKSVIPAYYHDRSLRPYTGIDDD